MSPRISLPVRAAAARIATGAAALALAAGCASGPAEQAGSRDGPPNTGGTAPTNTGPGQTTASGEREPSGERSSDAADVTVEATVEDGEVDPPPRRIEIDQGDDVRLEISSDGHTHIHVHGYDLEAEAAPSEPAVITFTADRTGVFEVETHEPALQIVQLQVR